MNSNHIIIFSHGFGVKKDDRGLFTDIAATFPESKTVMFDYNEIHEENNTLTVRPFSEQATMLQQTIQEQQTTYPEAIIDLICHSQGCRIAAIAKPTGIRKTIFLAPPTDSGIERMLDRYRKNTETVIDLNGVTLFPRTDGSTTRIPASYFKERENEPDPIEEYNKLSTLTELIIITATQNTVLGETSFVGLNECLPVIRIDGNHDFQGETRRMLIQTIHTQL